MIVDATEIEAGSTLEADLCIVGSGPAGMAIARRFDGTSVRVLMLESGGFERSSAVQTLYAGRSIGRRYFDIDACRQRYFGGSSNCWAGLCRPLDPEDFTARDWVPHSGWPIDHAALAPWYREAEALLGLDATGWQVPPAHGPARWPLDARVESRFFKLSAPIRLGKTERARLTRSTNVRICLNATVVRIGLTANTKRVDRLHVRRSVGTGGFTVRAQRYVLACGGIENPRLLLASDAEQARGVGNQHDLVGRYFMEHPHTDRHGVLIGGAALKAPHFYRRHRMGTQRIWGHFMLSAATRQAERLLSAAVVFLPHRANPPPLSDAVHAASRWMDGAPGASTRLTFGTPSEQVPNPESRVRLDSARDRLGVPRAMLDWRVRAVDKYSVERTHAILAEALAAAGIGRVRLTLPKGPRFPKAVNGGRHHMGTTRMHADPKRGVVDADCRVHGVADLYVAGSSVFPTSGSANPTLTLTALAFRLATHLQTALAR